MKRFWYITAPTGNVVHLAYGRRMEGDPLACGRRIKKGWHWLTPRPLKMKRCKQCLDGRPGNR